MSEKRLTFGEYVKRQREDKALTQAELADRVGMSQPWICQIEAGIHSPTMRTIQRIMDGLDLDISEYFQRPH